MQLIQIGDRIINLDQVTSVEYIPEEVHPGNPVRIYSSITINYASDTFNFSRFYEEEADALWFFLRQRATLNLRDLLEIKRQQDDLDELEESFTTSLD
jgi:hypothetical protein